MFTIVETQLARHPEPKIVRAPSAYLGLAPDAPIDSDEFVAAAGHAAQRLPEAVHDALVDFADRPNPSGALVLRNMPIGIVPATPASPTAPTGKDRISELTLLTIARRLGQPVGYAPEHGGHIVQNLVPTKAGAAEQVSTSSAVTLAWHTETAFHPHKPRYLVLLCLRGNPDAATLLCSIDAVLPHVSAETRALLAEPRFRTSPDRSFLEPGSVGELGAPMAVLDGDTFTFDADLMVGMDLDAERALVELREAIEARHIGVVLEAGDVLVIDNHRAVHGRSAFGARFDGTDRWLQRSFVVADLSASAKERDGRVISTRW
jgi:L-asparagine oxygenase